MKLNIESTAFIGNSLMKHSWVCTHRYIASVWEQYRMRLWLWIKDDFLFSKIWYADLLSGVFGNWKSVISASSKLQSELISSMREFVSATVENGIDIRFDNTELSLHALLIIVRLSVVQSASLQTWQDSNVTLKIKSKIILRKLCDQPEFVKNTFITMGKYKCSVTYE